MRLFLDSSALTKRYIQEKGSDTVEALLAQAGSLGVCVTCLPEIISALCRKLRESNLARQQYETARGALLTDLEDTEVVQLTPEVLTETVALLEKYPLRAMDALQVGSAIQWKANLFASADKNQLRAAAKTGLKTREV